MFPRRTSRYGSEGPDPQPIAVESDSTAIVGKWNRSTSAKVQLEAVRQMFQGDVYHELHRYLVQEKIATEGSVIRMDMLKALARKWKLHQLPGFWEKHPTKFQLAIALLEHVLKLKGGAAVVSQAKKRSKVRRRLSNSDAPPSRPAVTHTSDPRMNKSASMNYVAWRRSDNDVSGGMVYLSRFPEDRRASVAGDTLDSEEAEDFQQEKALSAAIEKSSYLKEIIPSQSISNNLRLHLENSLKGQAFLDLLEDAEEGAGEEEVKESDSPTRKAGAKKVSVKVALRGQAAAALRDLSKPSHTRLRIIQEGAYHALLKVLNVTRRLGLMEEADQYIETTVKDCLVAVAHLSTMHSDHAPTNASLYPGITGALCYVNRTKNVSEEAKLAIAIALYNFSRQSKYRSRLSLEGATACFVNLMRPSILLRTKPQSEEELKQFKAKVEWDTAILACCIRGLCNISGDPVGVVTVLDSEVIPMLVTYWGIIPKVLRLHIGAHLLYNVARSRATCGPLAVPMSLLYRSILTTIKSEDPQNPAVERCLRRCLVGLAGIIINSNVSLALALVRSCMMVTPWQIEKHIIRTKCLEALTAGAFLLLEKGSSTTPNEQSPANVQWQPGGTEGSNGDEHSSSGSEEEYSDDEFMVVDETNVDTAKPGVPSPESTSKVLSMCMEAVAKLLWSPFNTVAVLQGGAAFTSRALLCGTPRTRELATIALCEVFQKMEAIDVLQRDGTLVGLISVLGTKGFQSRLDTAAMMAVFNATCHYSTGKALMRVVREEALSYAEKLGVKVSLPSFSSVRRSSVVKPVAKEEQLTEVADTNASSPIIIVLLADVLCKVLSEFNGEGIPKHWNESKRSKSGANILDDGSDGSFPTTLSALTARVAHVAHACGVKSTAGVMSLISEVIQGKRPTDRVEILVDSGIIRSVPAADFKVIATLSEVFRARTEAMLLADGTPAPKSFPDHVRVVSFALAALRNLSGIDGAAASIVGTGILSWLVRIFYCTSAKGTGSPAVASPSSPSRGRIRSNPSWSDTHTVPEGEAAESDDQTQQPHQPATSATNTKRYHATSAMEGRTPMAAGPGGVAREAEKSTRQVLQSRSSFAIAGSMALSLWSHVAITINPFHSLPLQCLTDALLILANVSAQPATRGALIANGVLPIMVDIACDKNNPYLTRAFEASQRHAFEHIRALADLTRFSSLTNDLLTGKQPPKPSFAPTPPASPLRSPLSHHNPANPPIYEDGKPPVGPRPPSHRSLRRGSSASSRSRRSQGHAGEELTSVVVGGKVVPGVTHAEKERLEEYNEVFKEELKEATAHAAMCLINLACDPDRPESLQQPGVVRALGVLLDNINTEEPLRKRITSSFRTMSTKESIGKDLLEDTFLHAIVRQCSSSSESIRKDCVSILYNLSKLEGSEAPLQRNGAVPALLGVALIRSRDAALRAKCVDTIHNIICEPGVRIKALKEGVVWGLEKLVRVDEMQLRRACALALYRISTDHEAQQFLIREGGLSAAIFALKHPTLPSERSPEDGKAEEGEEHAGGEEEEESVMRMLDLVKNAEREKADDLQLLLSEMNTANRAKLQEAETLDPLNESIAALFAGVLAATSREKGNEDKLVEEGAVEALVMLARKANAFAQAQQEEGAATEAGAGPGGLGLGTQAPHTVMAGAKSRKFSYSQLKRAESDKPRLRKKSNSVSDLTLAVAEEAQNSDLRASCALGLYNLSCTKNETIQQRFLDEGALHVFIDIGTSIEESLHTHRLCVLGIGNLLCNSATRGQVASSEADTVIGNMLNSGTMNDGYGCAVLLHYASCFSDSKQLPLAPRILAVADKHLRRCHGHIANFLLAMSTAEEGQSPLLNEEEEDRLNSGPMLLSLHVSCLLTASITNAVAGSENFSSQHAQDLPLGRILDVGMKVLEFYPLLVPLLTDPKRRRTNQLRDPFTCAVVAHLMFDVIATLLAFLGVRWEDAYRAVNSGAVTFLSKLLECPALTGETYAKALAALRNLTFHSQSKALIIANPDASPLISSLVSLTLLSLPPTLREKADKTEALRTGSPSRNSPPLYNTGSKQNLLEGLSKRDLLEDIRPRPFAPGTMLALLDHPEATSARENAARVLCNMSLETKGRGLLVANDAAHALIAVSDMPETEPLLKNACIRAICQIAITSGLSTTEQGTSDSFSRTEVSRVINSGAVGALIAVMGKDPNDDDETDSDSEGGRGFRGGAGEDDEDDDDDAVIKRVLQASVDDDIFQTSSNAFRRPDARIYLTGELTTHDSLCNALEGYEAWNAALLKSKETDTETTGSETPSLTRVRGSFTAGLAGFSSISYFMTKKMPDCVVQLMKPDFVAKRTRGLFQGARVAIRLRHRKRSEEEKEKKEEGKEGGVEEGKASLTFTKPSELLEDSGSTRDTSWPKISYVTAEDRWDILRRNLAPLLGSQRQLKSTLMSGGFREWVHLRRTGYRSDVVNKAIAKLYERFGEAPNGPVKDITTSRPQNATTQSSTPSPHGEGSFWEGQHSFARSGTASAMSEKSFYKNDPAATSLVIELSAFLAIIKSGAAVGIMHEESNEGLMAWEEAIEAAVALVFNDQSRGSHNHRKLPTTEDTVKGLVLDVAFDEGLEFGAVQDTLSALADNEVVDALIQLLFLPHDAAALERLQALPNPLAALPTSDEITTAGSVAEDLLILCVAAVVHAIFKEEIGLAGPNYQESLEVEAERQRLTEQGNMTELEAKNTIIGVFQNYKSKPAEEDYARSLVSQLTAKATQFQREFGAKTENDSYLLSAAMNRLRAGTVGDHSALGKGALVKSPDSPLPGDRLEPDTPRAQASKPSANPPPVVNSIIHQVEEKTRQRDKEFDSSRHRRARFVVEGPNGRAYGPKMPIMSPIKPQPPGSARQHEPHHARDYDEHPAPPYDVLNATRGSTATVGMSQSRSSHRSSTFFEVAPKPPVLPPVLLRLFNDSHGDQKSMSARGAASEGPRQSEPAGSQSARLGMDEDTVMFPPLQAKSAYPRASDNPISEPQGGNNHPEGLTPNASADSSTLPPVGRTPGHDKYFSKQKKKKEKGRPQVSQQYASVLYSSPLPLSGASRKNGFSRPQQSKATGKGKSKRHHTSHSVTQKKSPR